MQIVAIKGFEIPKKCIWDCPLVEVEDIKIIKISEKATNGDIIKALFGAEEIKRADIWIETDLDNDTVFNLRWWNSPYEGGKNDNGNVDI